MNQDNREERQHLQQSHPRTKGNELNLPCIQIHSFGFFFAFFCSNFSFFCFFLFLFA